MSILINRAKLAGKILRFAPFIRMAALNGSIVRGGETKESDIDILIIAKDGRLYTCRAFAVLLIHLTGWRRHGNKIAGRICLNCYLNDKSPNIFPENKKSAAKVAKAYKYLICLVDDGVSKKFFAQNKWLNNYRADGSMHSHSLKKFIFKDFPLAKKNNYLNKVLGGRFGDFIEKWLMAYQQKRILKSKQKDDEIFVNERAIKLHPKKQ